MGRLKHEALREEVHCFGDFKITEAAPIASVQIAVQPCTCCNAIWSHCSIFGHYVGDETFSVPGSKPTTNSITLAEDISHGFTIDPGPANR
ncbi:hypothetical protein ABIA10_006544 [Rhizobium leguminosarum]